MKEYNIIAVTVTYNRSETLDKNIKSLINQTCYIDKIIIVDNCSNEEHKTNISNIKNYDERIEVIYLDENLGGAGGFHYGMKYALDKYNPNWYWIMDDDAYPTQNCLKTLMKYSNLDNIGFLAPVIYGIGKNEYQLYHHKCISKNLVKDIKLFKNVSDIREIDFVEANAFVGPLISKKAVEKVGIPDKDLFIYGDDTEYTFRITRYLKGIIVKDSIINHEDVFSSNNLYNIKDWWKQYYKFRNRYLLIDSYSSSIISKTYSKLILTVQILLIMIKQMFKSYSFKHKKIIIKVLLKSIKDGFKKAKGKCIDPSEYMKGL